MLPLLRVRATYLAGGSAARVHCCLPFDVPRNAQTAVRAPLDANRFCLQGYNASIVAYGQTGTGKTYTMEGERTGEERGIIPRAIEDVFRYIQRDTGERCKFLVRASYLQIYNEVRRAGRRAVAAAPVRPWEGPTVQPLPRGGGLVSDFRINSSAQRAGRCRGLGRRCCCVPAGRLEVAPATPSCTPLLVSCTPWRSAAPL